MERFEKSVESVIKAVLETLRRRGAGTGGGLSEWELERETREKILNKPEVLQRLRHNPKISYDPVSGKYQFKPMFPIRNRAELVELIRGRAGGLTVDQDLLDCYGTVEEDVKWLLNEKTVLAVRNGDVDKTLKCEKAAGEAAKNKVKVNTVAKCSLYAVNSRCGVCADNKGIVLAKKFAESAYCAEAPDDMKELWFAQTMPIASEIHKAAAMNAEADGMQTAESLTHLTASSTQHMLTKSSIAKLKAAARMNQRQRKRAADGTLKTESIANEHVLEHLTGAAEK